MTLTPRPLLAALVAVAALWASPSTALAQQDYPNKPVKWIVPYPPAGTTDVLARMARQGLDTLVGTPAPAEARPNSAPPGPEGDTRRVCRLERATGSNIQQRVCRDIPRAGFQDQQTREFMRSMQRPRLPDRETPQGPVG